MFLPQNWTFAFWKAFLAERYLPESMEIVLTQLLKLLLADPQMNPEQVFSLLEGRLKDDASSQDYRAACCRLLAAGRYERPAAETVELLRRLGLEETCMLELQGMDYCPASPKLYDCLLVKVWFEGDIEWFRSTLFRWNREDYRHDRLYLGIEAEWLEFLPELADLIKNFYQFLYRNDGELVMCLTCPYFVDYAMPYIPSERYLLPLSEMVQPKRQELRELVIDYRKTLCRSSKVRSRIYQLSDQIIELRVRREECRSAKLDKKERLAVAELRELQKEARYFPSSLDNFPDFAWEFGSGIGGLKMYVYALTSWCCEELHHDILFDRL